MKLYLSSFGVGDSTARLSEMMGTGPVAMIPNAMDHVGEPDRTLSNERARGQIEALGIEVEEIDLRDFFDARGALPSALEPFAGVWVRGGNTFVLRRAMSLSGFDTLLPDLLASGKVYGGYSAGVCVLAPSLEGIGRVDDPDVDPYGLGRTIWEGLAVLPYLVLPHYRSDHPESRAIDGEVEYCERHGIAFRTLRDGEVIVVDGDPDV